MENQDEQQKMQQYQLLYSQLETLQEESERIDNEIHELENTKQTIGKLKKLKEGKEVAMPVGSGTFAFGKLGNTDKVLINLGADSLAKKSIKEAKRILEGRKKEINKVKNTVSDNIERITKRLQELGPKLQGMDQGR